MLLHRAKYLLGKIESGVITEDQLIWQKLFLSMEIVEQ